MLPPGMGLLTGPPQRTGEWSPCFYCRVGSKYNPVSVRDDREYMGAILQYQTGFSYTVTAGIKGRNQVTARIRIPKGGQLVALWHTHGSPHHTRRSFSSIDTQLVERTNLPFYLVDPRNNYWVFRPGDRLLSVPQSRRRGLGASRGYAQGKRVVLRTGASRPIDYADWYLGPGVR